MIKSLLEKIGLRHTPWWEHVFHGRLLTVASIIVVAGGLGLLAYVLQEGTLGDAEKAQRAQSELKAAQEAGYRNAVLPLMTSYVTARSVYQEKSTDQETLRKWRTLAQNISLALLEQTVPTKYQNFHLGAVIALSLEQSALDDLLGEASDTGVVGSGGLRERGEAKLQDAEARWRNIFENEKEWLRI